MRLSSIIAVVSRNAKIWLWKIAGKRNSIKPYKVLISLTNECNSRCVYCDIWKINKNAPELRAGEITLSHVDNLLRDMGDDLLWLSLSGGEVTLVPWFREMIDAAGRHCKNLKIVTFTTNALAPHRAVDYARYIRDRGYDVFVTISLDGDEETHDRLRGIEGNYQKCQKTYRMLSEEKIPVHYGITVADSNLEFIKNNYVAMSKEMKSVTFVHSGGIYDKANAVDYNKVFEGMKWINRHYAIDHLSQLIEKIHIKCSLFFMANGMSASVIPCEVINTSLHVMQDGEVKPCMFLPSMGNIKKSGISDILNSEEASRLRVAVEKDQCPHCWMNCYSPHAIMQHPIRSLRYLFSRIPAKIQ